MESGTIIGTRDHDFFSQALFSGQTCKIISGFAPPDRMHLGHGDVVKLLTYYQQLGVKIVIPIKDLEAMIVRRMSSAEARNLAIEEFILNSAALGLDIEKADIYSQHE